MNLCLSRAILQDIVDSTKVIHAERKALLIKEYLFKTSMLLSSTVKSTFLFFPKCFFSREDHLVTKNKFILYGIMFNLVSY